VSTRYRIKTLECYEAIADVSAQAQAHSNLSATYICRGNLERALHHAREALKIDERTGDLTGNAITEGNLAEILVMRGAYEEAIQHCQIALDLFERAGGAQGGAHNMMGFALMMLSRALTRQGLYDEAATHLDDAMALLEGSGATTYLAEARLQRAELLIATGQLERALAEDEQGLKDAREQGMRLMEIRGLWLLGRITAAAGDITTAERCLKESEDLARRAAASYERALAQLALAELYAANGRPYRRALAKAIGLLEPTGAAPDIERARRLAAEPR
jgi:tetratricopeptide (TPR) repeat protein